MIMRLACVIKSAATVRPSRIYLCIKQPDKGTQPSSIYTHTYINTCIEHSIVSEKALINIIPFIHHYLQRDQQLRQQHSRWQ